MRLREPNIAAAYFHLRIWAVLAMSPAGRNGHRDESHGGEREQGADGCWELDHLGREARLSLYVEAPFKAGWLMVLSGRLAAILTNCRSIEEGVPNVG